MIFMSKWFIMYVQAPQEGTVGAMGPRYSRGSGTPGTSSWYCGIMRVFGEEIYGLGKKYKFEIKKRRGEMRRGLPWPSSWWGHTMEPHNSSWQACECLFIINWKINQLTQHSLLLIFGACKKQNNSLADIFFAQIHFEWHNDYVFDGSFSSDAHFYHYNQQNKDSIMFSIE